MNVAMAFIRIVSVLLGAAMLVFLADFLRERIALKKDERKRWGDKDREDK